MRKRKKSRFSKHEKGILSSILLGHPIFIKNTGVEVTVGQIEKDYYKFIPEVQVHMKSNPTPEAIMASVNCRLNNNHMPHRLKSTAVGHPVEPEPNFVGQMTVKLENLSTSPYETKAARILYKKRK